MLLMLPTTGGWEYVPKNTCMATRNIIANIGQLFPCLIVSGGGGRGVHKQFAEGRGDAQTPNSNASIRSYTDAAQQEAWIEGIARPAAHCVARINAVGQALQVLLQQHAVKRNMYAPHTHAHTHTHTHTAALAATESSTPT
jgi:hypothetical protein